MKYIFLIILSFCIQTTQAQSNKNQTDSKGLKQGFWEKKQDGKLIYQGYFKDNKPTDKWVRYHSNGFKQAILIYDNDTAKATLFNTHGKKIATGSYLNEKKVGLWKYFKNNVLISDELYRNGQKEGEAHSYYEDGALFESTTYANNQKNGVYKSFTKEGKLFFECMYKDDLRDGYSQLYYPNGQVETSGYYEKGIRHQDWQYYNEDGSKAYLINYEHGMVTNPAVRDSVEALKFKQLEKDKDQITDPADYTQNPYEYMNKENIPLR